MPEAVCLVAAPALWKSQRMNIVILDAACANPGDLSFAELEALGSVTSYERTPPEHTVERAKPATVLLTNKVVLDRETLAALPRLKLVSVLATGTNVVDLEAARELGVSVCNVPGYSTASVAQHTLALLLELTQAVGRHSHSAKRGHWSESPDFCYWEQELVELEGRTLGVVGYGAIGKRVAKLAQALGMRLLVHTRTPPEDVRPVALDELFARSDVVSLHCPLSESTHHLVNAERLALMKPSAYLLNTSRGPLVDESALAEALDRRLLAGAAVDVLSIEPPAADNPLLAQPRCLVTPHIAWATRAARERLLAISAANVRAFLEGKPIHVVNG